MNPIHNRNAAISFLRSIGLEIREGDVCTASFLPNITIKDGALIYNDKCDVSDILHEAGHLAAIPTKYRTMCQADMKESIPAIWEKAMKAGEIEPDSPMYCALIQSSDPEATAWAWAAGRHIGLEPEEIIRDHQYEGTGADIRAMLAVNCYCGINGLRAAGMVASIKTFPQLKQWVQP